MRTRLIGLVVVLLAAPSLAANPTYLGEKPPTFGFGVFANTVLPHRGLQDFEGEVVVLEFLRTSCPGCRAVMPSLDRTYRKYDRPDVHVFCVTNDTVELVQRFLIHEGAGRKLQYPITTGCRHSFGVTALPWTYVIGRGGKVAWAGHAGGGYAKALAAAVAASDPAMPDAPAGLRKAISRLVGEKYAKALELAAKARASEDTAPFGAYVEKRVAKQLDREMATVRRHAQRGDLFSAGILLDAMGKRFAGTPHLAAIEKRRQALEATPGAAAKREAWKRYHAAWNAARKGKGGMAQARKKLETLKAGDVASAARAADALLAVLAKPWTLDDAATFGAGRR